MKKRETARHRRERRRARLRRNRPSQAFDLIELHGVIAARFRHAQLRTLYYANPLFPKE